nr:S8 family serine peptidase [uncultured Lacibacter sp.]
MSYYVYQSGIKKKINSKNIASDKKQQYSMLIIRFRGGVSKHTDGFNKAMGMLRKKVYNKEDHIFLCYFKKMPVNKLAVLAKMYYDSGIADFAEPYVMHRVQNTALSFNDPKFSTQWIFENTGQFSGIPGDDIGILDGLRMIADEQITLDKTICVAVLDEGVDTTHPDLKNANLWHHNFSVFGANKLLPKEEDHHGTSVAGVIAAIQDNGVGIAGINPFCKIMSGRIYFTQDNVGGVNALRISEGIRKAVDNHARIINLSWRMEPSPLVADAIQYGVSKDVIFCAAAGNYMRAADDHSVQFPGRLDEVLTVAAVNNKSEWVNLVNTPTNQRFGSCYGREVDIAAPGLYISTTRNDGGYTNFFCGTSAATAIVSAVAAILLAINPALTARDVREYLVSTADPVLNGTAIEQIDRVGHGKLNAQKAIAKAIESLQI